MSAPRSFWHFWRKDLSISIVHEVPPPYEDGSDDEEQRRYAQQETRVQRIQDLSHNAELGYQDDVLIYNGGVAQDHGTASLLNPQPAKSRLRFAERAWWMLMALTLGFFLATCPIPKKNIPHPLWLFFTTFTASLVCFPTLGTRDPREFVGRLLVGYLGFYLSIFAIFGAAEQIHIDIRGQWLLWYQIHEGHKLGYMARFLLVVAGYFIQKSAGLYSRRRLLLMYLLCSIWVYADMYLTIFDLARGRKSW